MTSGGDFGSRVVRLHGGDFGFEQESINGVWEWREPAEQAVGSHGAPKRVELQLELCHLLANFIVKVWGLGFGMGAWVL